MEGVLRMEEISKKEEMLEKELIDTKAYLDIVMQELSDVKEQIQMQQPTPVIQSAPKKHGVWKYIAIAETVALLVGVGIFAAYKTNQDSVTAIHAEKTEPTTEPFVDTVAPIVKTRKINTSLIDTVAKTDFSQYPFNASVETLFGYEYLCLSYENVRIYYRNEFPTDVNHNRYHVMIDNGSKISEFDWTYDLNEPLKQLIPYVGDYFGESETLVFPVYQSQKNIPEQLRVVQVDTLNEYDYLDINEKLKEAFTITYEESSMDDYRMKMAIGSTSYTYKISKDTYVNALYYEEYPIQYDDYFTFEATKDGLILKMTAYLSNQEYLGELTAKVSANHNELILDSISYGAYVEANQEDVEREGLIVPRTTILPEEHLTIWGKKRETFLLEKSKVVEHNTLINEYFIEDENGYAYYEDGVKKTLFGIDVSKYQGDIDWEAVKAAGVEYAIIRVGFRGNREGTLEVDPYFHQNMNNAIKAGVNVGVYFFSQAITVEEALEEAEFVKDLIKDYKITYPVVFDTEQMVSATARANNLSRQLRTDIAKAFCNEMKNTGYHPMIYANTKQMIMGIDLEQLSEYDLWFAYYGSNLQFPYQFEMYQYSQEGRVNGIDGAVDLNLSFVDYSKE